MVSKSFALSGRLDSAVQHPEHSPRLRYFAALLEVQPGIEAVLEALHQSSDPAAWLDSQPFHDPPCLNVGKEAPGLHVDVNGYVHAVAILNRLEPDTVMGQPVFGVIDYDPHQLFLAQIVEQ